MAITTSPDNIPSPTSGDPYNYVVDMAALADGTQDALTQKANMGVGTSTQRTAALSKFPDGALWYDTTTSSEWRRIAGAWVDQDAGWVTYTPVWTSLGTSPSLGNGTLTGRYSISGKTVNYWITVVMGSTTAFGSDAYVFSLPVDMRAVSGALSLGSAAGYVGTTRYSGSVLSRSPSNTTHVVVVFGSTLVSAEAPAGLKEGNYFALSGSYEID